MQDALLYDRVEGANVLCRLCPWRCRIAPGESGLCRVRENQDGALYPLNYGLISAAAVEPIERRGVYHLFPGSVLLTLGGWGDNLHCRFRPAPPELPGVGEKQRYLDAERAIDFAVEHHCRGLAWGYQEPAVWLEYVLDSAKLARANGLFTLLLTRGFVSEEAIDLLGPYLDACAVEILAASGQPYEQACGLPDWEAILRSTAHARERWRCHVEVHTPLIAGVNGEEEMLRGLASWIREKMGVDTPWHLLHFEPAGEMAGKPPASPAELERAQEVGREAGLRYVYVQSGEEAGLTHTLCPSCGQVLIRREGKFYVRIAGIEDGKCARCGQEIYLRRSIFK